MQSDAATVKEYLEGLPGERRRAIAAVRTVIRKNLPRGYREGMGWGMITYEVPLKTCPDTYNGKPLMYAALASQKNHMAIYLCGCYANEASRTRLEQAFSQAGKRLDAGKSCIRFKRLDDLVLEAIGAAVAEFEVEDFVAMVQSIHTRAKKRR